jgi:hypothetical protein
LFILCANSIKLVFTSIKLTATPTSKNILEIVFPSM